MVSEEITRYPGYRWAVTPSTYYENPEGPWVWVTYSEPDDEGLCARRQGFAESQEDAHAMVGNERVC